MKTNRLLCLESYNTTFLTFNNCFNKYGFEVTTNKKYGKGHLKASSANPSHPFQVSIQIDTIMQFIFCTFQYFGHQSSLWRYLCAFFLPQRFLVGLCRGMPELYFQRGQTFGTLAVSMVTKTASKMATILFFHTSLSTCLMSIKHKYILK